MSHFASPKTAQIWAEHLAQCERSNAPVAQFCQSWPIATDQFSRSKPRRWLRDFIPRVSAIPRLSQQSIGASTVGSKQLSSFQTHRGVGLACGFRSRCIRLDARCQNPSGPKAHQLCHTRHSDR
jgi:hypothetical protein